MYNDGPTVSKNFLKHFIMMLYINNSFHIFIKQFIVYSFLSFLLIISFKVVELQVKLRKDNQNTNMMFHYCQCILITIPSNFPIIMILLFELFCCFNLSAYCLYQTVIVIAFGSFFGWKTFELFAQHDFAVLSSGLPKFLGSVDSIINKIQLFCLFAILALLVIDASMLYHEKNWWSLCTAICVIVFWKRGADPEQLAFLYLGISGLSVATIVLAYRVPFPITSYIEHCFCELQAMCSVATPRLQVGETSTSKRKKVKKQLYQIENSER